MSSKNLNGNSTWDTDDGSDVLPAAGTVDFTVTVVETLRQRRFSAAAVDAAQRQLRSIAAEEIGLNGVLSVAQAQLPAHDHRLEQTPSVSTHQSPTC